MSLYNAINGYNLSCIFIMPMLGRRDREYPRFRDCFVSEDGQHIDIFTRVGGGNRGCGMGEEELYKDPLFVTTFDDEYDNTYATYQFEVPEKWKKDFDLIVDGRINETSAEYQEMIRGFWSEKMKPFLDKAFSVGNIPNGEENS